MVITPFKMTKVNALSWGCLVEKLFHFEWFDPRYHSLDSDQLEVLFSTTGSSEKPCCGRTLNLAWCSFVEGRRRKSQSRLLGEPEIYKVSRNGDSNICHSMCVADTVFRQIKNKVVRCLCNQNNLLGLDKADKDILNWQTVKHEIA